MPVATEIRFKDEDGFHYRHPERSCKRCLNYPCIESMDKLRGDFAKYGCNLYKDENIFEECKK